MNLWCSHSCLKHCVPACVHVCACVSTSCFKRAAQQRAEFIEQHGYPESAEFRSQGRDNLPYGNSTTRGRQSREGTHTAAFYLCPFRSLHRLTEPFIGAGTLKPRLSYVMSLRRSDLLSCLLLSVCFLWMGDIIRFQ